MALLLTNICRRTEEALARRNDGWMVVVGGGDDEETFSGREGYREMTVSPVL